MRVFVFNDLFIFNEIDSIGALNAYNYFKVLNCQTLVKFF